MNIFSYLLLQSEMIILSLFTLMISVLLSSIFLPIFRKFALEKDIIAVPSIRRSHTNKIPVLGGVSIYFVLFFTILIVSQYLILIIEIERFIQLYYFGFASSILFSVGLIDDVYGLKPRIKLFFQLIASYVLICITDILIIDSMYGLFGIFKLQPIISCPLTIFIFIVFVNMLNLIDGIDGLASGISIVALAFFVIISFLSNNNVSLILSIAGLGSLLPFFYYNVYSDKKIFLGDNGSLLLGILLIYLTLDFLSFDTTGILLIGNNKILLLMSLFSYPLVDTMRIFIVRILRKKSPFSADKNHIHHHLLRLGYSHKRASTFILMYTCLITIISLFFMKQNINTSFVILLILSVTMICLPTFLTKNESGSIGFLKKIE